MYQKMSSLAKVMIGTSMLGIYGILFPNQASAVNCWEIHDLSECAKHPECMEHQEANGFCQGEVQYHCWPHETQEACPSPHCHWKQPSRYCVTRKATRTE
ncbi:MAG: hypothetical protein KA112_01785 [Alphaproteobacteria bacterium]|nr:hypothetical protein [Alphaproteobacteria bacterium]MBP7729333.1 hypothetical protein [Alphaproteobacteria bacterium]